MSFVSLTNRLSLFAIAAALALNAAALAQSTSPAKEAAVAAPATPPAAAVPEDTEPKGAMAQCAAAAAATAAESHAPLPALTPELTRFIYEQAKPSLVIVQYTFIGDLGRQDFIGQGVVVKDDGLVMTPMSFIPMIPDSQLHDFKIILPGDDENETEATFVGRDERCSVAYVCAAKPQHWKAVKFVEHPAQVGDAVLSVGLLPKSAGYHPFISTPAVSAILRGPVPQVLVNAAGLTSMGSPVFNTAGDAIGLVNSQGEQGLYSDTRNPIGSVFAPSHPNIPEQLDVLMRAEQAMSSPCRTYVPSRDFLQSLGDPPAAGVTMKSPWLGITALHGLEKDVLEAYKLTGQTAVQVGDVIKDTPASKAGIKAGDIIVKMDGKALERGDEADEAAEILLRKVRRMKIGSEMTFSIMSSTDAPARDVTVTLAERPRAAHEAERFYAPDLGFATREIVFDDTYRRKLPADTKGIIVALVKPSSAAQTGHLAMGDLINQLNREPVTDLAQFKKSYEDFRKDKPNEPVVLQVRRGGNTEVIRIEPPQ